MHHQIPLLSIVCSNRSYFNDEEHQERVALQRNRPVENKTIGIRIEDPNVDFGAMARTYGCWGAGPITEPKDLIKTLREAVKVVKEGQARAGRCGVPDALSQFEKDLFSAGLSRVKRSTEPSYFLGRIISTLRDLLQGFRPHLDVPLRLHPSEVGAPMPTQVFL